MNTTNEIVVPTQDFGAHFDAAVRTICNTRGKNQTENQDNYCLIDANGLAKYMLNHEDCYHTVENWPQGHIRLAIIDGMGGHEQGRQVAEETAQCLTELPACFDQAQLSTQLTAIHYRLQERFKQLNSSPGCTLTLLEIPAGKSAMLFHVGDSRLYFIDHCGCESLTIDHVPATRLLMDQQIDAETWRQQVYFESRFELSQAFALGNNFTDSSQLDSALYELNTDNLPAFLQPFQDRRLLPLSKSGVYLLGTDGLWCQRDPQVFINKWPAFLNKPERNIQSLVDDLMVELILNASEDQHQDNATAILFRCN